MPSRDGQTNGINPGCHGEQKLPPGHLTSSEPSRSSIGLEQVRKGSKVGGAA